MSMSMPKAQWFLAPTLVFFFFISTANARGLLVVGNTTSNSPPPPPSPPSSFVAKFDKIQQEFLNAHNELRSSVGVPPLQWDSTLATSANSWATHRRHDCDYRKHSTSPYGENIFWQQYKEYNPAAVVKKWFSEKQLFDHIKNVCKCHPEKDGCECGHYLTIIWKTTKKVGCSGFVYCNDQKGVYVVCSYDPIGNIKGVNPLNPSQSPNSSSIIETGSPPPPSSYQTPYGNTPPSPYSHQTPYGNTHPPPSPYSHQTPYGNTPPSPYSHQTPYGNTPPQTITKSSSKPGNLAAVIHPTVV